MVLSSRAAMHFGISPRRWSLPALSGPVPRSGLFALVLLIALSAVATARQADFAFPDDLAGFARGRKIDFESRKPGLGYSVSYTNGRWTADVYVYDGGVASILDGPSSPPVAAQIAMATNDINLLVERGLYRSGRDLGGVRLSGAAGDRLSCRGFKIDHSSAGPTESLLCITGLRGKFVKFRLSSQASKQAPVAEAERFLADWFAQQ